jgi:hypothetical protein
MSDINLVNAVINYTAKVKEALDTRTAPDSFKLEGLSLVDVLLRASEETGLQIDVLVDHMVQEFQNGAIELGISNGGILASAIVPKYIELTGSVIDVQAANHFGLTVTEETFLEIENPPAAGRVIDFFLHLKRGGSSIVNWWPNIRWENGKAPRLSSSDTDLLRFISIDGGENWIGIFTGDSLK